MADCLFCRLVAGELPARVVHETDSVLTFHDIDPKAPTHLLAIPKRHYRDVGAMVEADPGLAGQVLEAAHAAAKTLGIDASGYRLVFNTGVDASQTVFHVHCHILGGRRMTWPPG